MLPARLICEWRDCELVLVVGLRAGWAPSVRSAGWRAVPLRWLRVRCARRVTTRLFAAWPPMGGGGGRARRGRNRQQRAGEPARSHGGRPARPRAPPPTPTRRRDVRE